MQKFCGFCEQQNFLPSKISDNKVASELGSDLRDTMDQGNKLLVDFNAGKTQLVLFHWSNNTGAIDVKMDGSVLEQKIIFLF